MGVVQLPDELQREIERQVAEGRAQSAAAFVAAAVRRLIDEIEHDEDELAAAVAAGIADIEAGRFVTLETKDDWTRLDDRIAARVREQLASEG